MKEYLLLLCLVLLVEDLIGYTSWHVCGPYSSRIKMRRFGNWKLYEGLSMECWRRASLRGLHSNFYGNNAKDRGWQYHCSENPKALKCNSTGFVNNFNGKVNYVCPRGGYISGMYGTYSLAHRDRRYKFKCCHDDTGAHEECYWVGWRNCFGKELRFWVPDGYYLAGVKSERNNTIGSRDRIWDFYVSK